MNSEKAVNMGSARLNTIDFAKTNPFVIQSEQLGSWKQSFFADAYANGATAIGDIVSYNITNTAKNKKHEALDNDFFYDVKEYNNIVTFTGDRGSGKTTAMLSFVNGLFNIAAAKNEQDPYYNPMRALLDYRFETLPVIDPSKLSEDESLLTLVVSRIYERIQNEAKQSPNYEKLRDVVEKCEKVYNAIRTKYLTIKASLDHNPDDLEHLVDLANTSRLRRSMYELVHEYLKISPNLSERQSSNNSFLIIPIDDLDTNIHKGASLAEELRCYFMIPNVIVVMALRMEQLSDLMEKRFMDDFAVSLSKEYVMDVQPAEMATKYIQKLIPFQRRIHLPVLHHHDISSLTIIPRSTDTEQTGEQISLVEYFFKRIQKKTGILLVENEHGSHQLLPLNLRAIHQLVFMLEDMPDVDIYEIVKCQQEGKDGEREKLSCNLVHNLQRLEFWIVDGISSNAVPRYMANILRGAIEQPNEGFNAYWVRHLAKYGINEKIQGMNNKGEIAFTGLFGRNPLVFNILNTEGRPENISIGDILLLLKEMEEKNLEDGLRHFASAVIMLYSIRISRLMFSQEKCNYKGVKRLLGQTICNPGVRLTASGREARNPEWIPNAEAIRALIKWDNGIYYLDGRKTEISDRTPMTVEQAAWLSFFVLAYYRIGRAPQQRHFDLHVFAEEDYPVHKLAANVTRDDGSRHLSLHWLGFVLSSLTPDDVVDDLLWLFMENSKLPKDLIKLIGDMETWRDSYISALPLYSMEVISRLISQMNMHRYEYDFKIPISSDAHQEDSGKGIGQLNNFFDICLSLREQLDAVIDKTCGKELLKANLLKALDECPLIYVKERGTDKLKLGYEYFGTYMEKQPDHGERCFDWLDF